MKKIVILIISVMFLCSCTNQSIEVGDFSYEEDKNIYLSNDVSVKTEGFKNTNKTTIESPEDVIELAKNEVTISYNQISIDYDEEDKVWRVDFYQKSEKRNEYILGGNQTIYLDNHGITLYIVSGE